MRESLPALAKTRFRYLFGRLLLQCLRGLTCSGGEPHNPPVNLHGVDIYLWTEGIPDIPKQVGNFSLTFISSRGTRVYPPPAPDVETSDWPQCRYLCEHEVDDKEVDGLMRALAEQGWRWTMCSKLFKRDGQNLFSEPY